MADCCVAVTSTLASAANNFAVCSSSADGASSATATAVAAAATSVDQKTPSQSSSTSVQRQPTGQKYSATELSLQRAGSTASERTRWTNTAQNNNNDVNRKKKKKRDSKEKHTEKTASTAASTAASTVAAHRRPLSLSVGRLPNYAAPTVSSQLRCLSVQAVHYKNLMQDVDGSRGSPRQPQQHCSRGRATAPTSPHVHICPRFQPPPPDLTPFRSRSKSVASTSLRSSSVDQRLKALQLHSGGKATPETAKTAAAASGARKTRDSSAAAAGRRSRSVDGRLRPVRGDTVTLSVFAPAAAATATAAKKETNAEISRSRRSNVDRGSRRAEPTDAAQARPPPRRDADPEKQKSRLLAVAGGGKLDEQQQQLRSRSADRRGLTTTTGGANSGVGSSSKDGQRRTVSTDSRSVRNSPAPVNSAGNTGTGSADVRQATAIKTTAREAVQTRGKLDTTSRAEGAKDEERQQSIRKSASFNSQKSEQNLQLQPSTAPPGDSKSPKNTAASDQQQQQQQQPQPPTTTTASKQSDKPADNCDSRGSTDEYKLKLAEKRRQAREAAQREAQLEQERAEKLRLEQEEARQAVEAERRELLERLEVERRRRELEETKRREQQESKEREENERKQRELVEKLEQEQREKQLAEEKARAEAEQREMERLEKTRLDEEERLERKRKLALIMQRVKVTEGTPSRSAERSASGDRASESVDNKHTTTTTTTATAAAAADIATTLNANSMSTAELLDMTNRNT